VGSGGVGWCSRPWRCGVVCIGQQQSHSESGHGQVLAWPGAAALWAREAHLQGCRQGGSSHCRRPKKSLDCVPWQGTLRGRGSLGASYLCLAQDSAGCAQKWGAGRRGVHEGSVPMEQGRGYRG
jgi:hypothetical protein